MIIEGKESVGMRETWVDYARALGLYWSFLVTPIEGCIAQGSIFHLKYIII